MPLRSLALAVLAVLLLSAGPKPKTPARKSPATAHDACATSADCMVFCPHAKGCCSSAPCGCMRAINRRFVEEENKDYAKTCRTAPKCEPVDCAWKQAIVAVCRDQRCVASATPAF